MTIYPYLGVCTNPDGDGMHWEMRTADEPCPVFGCDCTPKVYLLAHEAHSAQSTAGETIAALRRERDRAIETRENANACTLRVERERDRLLEREQHFARALGVTDGGQYRNDWDAAIARVLAERDNARADVDTLRAERDAFYAALAAIAGPPPDGVVDARTWWIGTFGVAVQDVDTLLEAIAATTIIGNGSAAALYDTANEIAAKRGEQG